MSLRIDPATASREELVAEVQRLAEVNERWSEGWQTIVEANRQGWIDQVRVLWRAAATLGPIINTMPNFPVADYLEFSEALINGAMAYANLPGMFKVPPPEL